MSKKFDGKSILRSLQNGEFDASIDDEIKVNRTPIVIAKARFL